MAIVLDPIYKMKLIESYFPLIYPMEKIHNNYVQSIRQTCYELVKQYKCKNIDFESNNCVPNSNVSIRPMLKSGSAKEQIKKFQDYVSSFTTFE